MLTERGNYIIRYEKVISFTKYLSGMIVVAYQEDLSNFGEI